MYSQTLGTKFFSLGLNVATQYKFENETKTDKNTRGKPHGDSERNKRCHLVGN